MLLSVIQNLLTSVATVEVCTSEDVDIRYLLTDSRQLGKDAAHTLFFAIKTDRNDGANYIPVLRKKGVPAI